jgi:TonB-linked SusC/RagA family outer membrane protein
MQNDQKRSIEKKMKKTGVFFRVVVSCLFVLGLSMHASAQLFITGRVTDVTNDPLPGVNIIIKGTGQGVVSDSDGSFTINVPNEQSVLVFSYIGFNTREIQVGSQRNLLVELTEDAFLIDEVVVVGYGIQRRVNLTGSVGTVNSQELVARVAPNTSSLLQGRVPGLQITQNSSMPGNEGVEMRIRGMGSYGSTNSPLVLIDGVEADLNKVNPNMIESVSVLKDAASAAIYGARAANGVILVTTKTGNEGNLRVEYAFNYSQQRPTTPMKRITNSVEYMELINKAIDFSNHQTGWRYEDWQIEMYRNGQDPTHPSYNPKQYPNSNWLDYLLRNGTIQQHFVNIRGGRSGTVFNAGLGYMDQEGLLIATGYRRYDFQLNMKSSLSSRVTFGTNINMNYGRRTDTAFNDTDMGNMNASRDQLRSAYAGSPLTSPTLPDGSGRWSANGWDGTGGNKNPIAQAYDGGGQLIDENYILASSYLNVEIIKGLNAEIKGGVRFNESQGKIFNATWDNYRFLPDVDGNYQHMPSTSAQSMRQRNDRTKFYTLYGTLTYTKRFLESHNLNVMAGYSMELYQTERLEGYRTGYEMTDKWYLSAGPSDGQTNTSSVGEWALMSYFGRLNYDYQGKYLLEYNMRYDGSSRLHPEGRWGLFPSIAGAWRITEEDFFDVSILNNLKLRGSWGILGNYGSGNYQYQAMLSGAGTGLTSTYNIGGKTVPFYYASRMMNDKIKWETTTTSNVGLDFDLFDSKIYGSVDYFVKNTKDIIRSLQVPNFVGISGPNVNQGEMKNTGWEFVLGHNNRIGDFFYNIKFNLDAYKNTLVSFGEREISGVNLREEGLPYNTYYVLLQNGVYQNQAEIDNEVGPNGQPVVRSYAGGITIKPGDIRYMDVSGPKGVPDGVIDSYDRTPVPGVFPKFSYGFNISAGYKDFDLNMFFQGVQGRKVYVNSWGISPFNQASPPPVFWRDAWDGEGTSNFIPHIYVDGYGPMQAGYSSFFLRDASYLRMKNIQIGYTLPKAYSSKVFIQNLRVYVSGDNLLTFTKFFDGQIDPERTGQGLGDALYPQAKIFTVGLNVTF